MNARDAGVRLVDDSDPFAHGAVLGIELSVRIGSARGSQSDAGVVADVVVRPEDRGTGIGITTTDADALERAGHTLLAAAATLREVRS